MKPELENKKRKSTKASFKRGKRAKIDKAKQGNVDSDHESKPELSDADQELSEVFYSSQRDYWASQGLSWWVADEPCSGWAMRTALSDQRKWQTFQLS